MSAKYTYEVRPKVPMRNFIQGKMINRPTVLQLDIDEVKNALKFGPVYRRFDTVHVERVTLINLEELHRPSYINVAPNNVIKVEEKERVTLANLDELNKSSYINVAPNNIIEAEEKVETKAVVDPIIEEEKSEETAEVIDASIEEASVEDSIVDNASIEEVSDNEEDPTNNASVEEVSEESVEEHVPELPANDDLGSEEEPESSEEGNEIEETETVEETATEQKSDNINTNVYHGHKKRRQH